MLHISISTVTGLISKKTYGTMPVKQLSSRSSLDTSPGTQIHMRQAQVTRQQAF